jgi:hypothetical protein
MAERVSDDQIEDELSFYGEGCKEGAVYADLRDARKRIIELEARVRKLGAAIADSLIAYETQTDEILEDALQKLFEMLPSREESGVNKFIKRILSNDELQL